jgi:hypothetical protein
MAALSEVIVVYNTYIIIKTHVPCQPLHPPAVLLLLLTNGQQQNN